MIFAVDVLEYMGKIDGGILVLLNLTYNAESYEATYFYTPYNDILTISRELEEIIGIIEEHPDYLELMSKIESIVVPHEQIFDKIQDFNLEKVLPNVKD